jgi:hypothetical protein
MTADPRLTALAFEGISNICLIQFHYDMKIRELATWLAESISAIMVKNDPQCRAALSTFNTFLNTEYSHNKH